MFTAIREGLEPWSCSMTFWAYFTLLLTIIDHGVTQNVFCSTTPGCGLNDLEASTIPDCCARPGALSYKPTPSSESCSLCFAYGWVQNIAEDRTSAQPQAPITAVEGQDIPLYIFFSKNGPLIRHAFAFTIQISSSTAEENVDYTLTHDVDVEISPANNVPISVTLSLLNDGVIGEEVENVTLTLVNAILADENEILLYDTVIISIVDNDITIGFPKREVTITEGDRETEICLVTEGVPALDTALDVTLIPVTADEKDLNLLTTEVVIGADATGEPCVKFSAAVDGDNEGDEILTLILSGPPNVRLQSHSLTVFIKDSDGAKQMFVCSKASDCSDSFTTESVADCCVMQGWPHLSESR
ncbi:hypothetical protein GBAR_LOCUS29051 [Geodia barretti]|uniref:Calx-beta domain-containing protein n=1 Tax=Geodia barretti TaxID=519541 RepID=A0AA35TST2_GEOBA|nr:hypothetical protein GBAR_LOCUS29051 [Geodia barretti]